jgi:hypothetical protein
MDGFNTQIIRRKLPMYLKYMIIIIIIIIIMVLQHELA